MAGLNWGYEFYLLVLKVITHLFTSLTRERYFQHSKIKFVSPRGHVISSICSTLGSRKGNGEGQNLSRTFALLKAREITQRLL